MYENVKCHMQDIAEHFAQPSSSGDGILNRFVKRTFWCGSSFCALGLRSSCKWPYCGLTEVHGIVYIMRDSYRWFVSCFHFKFRLTESTFHNDWLPAAAAYKEVLKWGISQWKFPANVSHHNLYRIRTELYF